MKKCIRFKVNDSGRRVCARFGTNVEGGESQDPKHSMVELSLKGYGLLDKSVNSTDVLVGMGIGVVGSGVVKYLIKAAGMQDSLPVMVQNWMPLLGSALAGTAAYMLERKSNKSRAEGHLVGAITAGAAAQAWGLLKSSYPEYFGDVVALKFAGVPNNYGLIVNSPTPAIGPGAFRGMIFNNPGRPLAGVQYADRPGLGRLAQLSMGDDRDGLEELMD
jgi:hypothetical protein